LIPDSDNQGKEEDAKSRRSAARFHRHPIIKKRKRRGSHKGERAQTITSAKRTRGQGGGEKRGSLGRSYVISGPGIGGKLKCRGGERFRRKTHISGGKGGATVKKKSWGIAALPRGGNTKKMGRFGGALRNC